jgi:kynurenine 3-monooxygenase
VNITIVGAGLAGSFLALCLGQRGEHRIDIYDRLPDPTAATGDRSSMNLGLSRRGLEALEHVGLRDTVQASAVPMRGRLVHDKNGRLRFTPYGDGGILAIGRDDLSATLVRAAGELPGVTFHFGLRCIDVDKELPAARFVDKQAGGEFVAPSDIVIGADGVFSVVRRAMHHRELAAYRQDYLEWGWRELTIGPGPDGSHRMAADVFHLWPRGDSMVFAHPNRDGSFTCTCVLPLRGASGPEPLASVDDVETHFRELFPDLLRLAPDIADQCLRRPTTHLLSIRTSPWHHDSKVVLVGDACHAVYPFLAQGMNAAFEDCIELDKCLRTHARDRPAAFAAYQQARKRNTDALAELSERNFSELRDTARSRLVRLEKACDTRLERLLGGRWMPLHSMVTNTTMPYAQAEQQAKRQRLLLGLLGSSLTVAAGVPIGRGLLSTARSGRRRTR